MTGISYRKTRDGEWVAYGPAAAIKPMTVVTVTKRDGSVKTEEIVEVGRPFTVDGQRMRYGYLRQEPRSRSHPSHSGSMCDECQERPAKYAATDMSGLSGRVCGRCYGAGDLSFA